jgi:ABC-type Fe3+/spermidine/putrescine transport system ATPase subunit
MAAVVTEPRSDPTRAMAEENAKGTVVLRGVTKRFGETTAVESVDLTVPGGSYVVLLGPSGCGKTTLLRMIGGHERIDAGEFLLDGARMNDVPPARRDISTVFQHYGLFPHKSVRDNVEFGLKMRGQTKEARRKRSDEALTFLDLTEFADRKPRQLSGGQQQRVALARALVTEPTVLLLDEPLGDLDRLLQLRMRVELRALQRRLRITFIHVTHNQEEALAIADQIVVMQDGRIQQVGRPQEVYTHPANLFTSGFMGDNNVMPGVVTAVDDGHARIEASGVDLRANPGSNTLAVGQQLHASVRASAIAAEPLTGDGGARSEARANEVVATLVFLEYLGDVVKLHCLLPNGQTMVAKLAERERAWSQLIEGEPIRLSWGVEDVQLLLG